jgi:hypothetical protein
MRNWFRSSPHHHELVNSSHLPPIGEFKLVLTGSLRDHTKKAGYGRNFRLTEENRKFVSPDLLKEFAAGMPKAFDARLPTEPIIFCGRARCDLLQLFQANDVNALGCLVKSALVVADSHGRPKDPQINLLRIFVQLTTSPAGQQKPLWMMRHALTEDLEEAAKNAVGLIKLLTKDLSTLTSDDFNSFARLVFNEDPVPAEPNPSMDTFLDFAARRLNMSQADFEFLRDAPVSPQFLR